MQGDQDGLFNDLAENEIGIPLIGQAAAAQLTSSEKPANTALCRVDNDPGPGYLVGTQNRFRILDPSLYS
jgi:hypothetical protein